MIEHKIRTVKLNKLLAINREFIVVNREVWHVISRVFEFYPVDSTQQKYTIKQHCQIRIPASRQVLVNHHTFIPILQYKISKVTNEYAPGMAEKLSASCG